MDKQFPNRQSIRLRGYDYSSEGLYFITICCQDKICRFGTVRDGEMILNEAGQMIMNIYEKLSDKFQDIVCHEFVVMPNHFHCIIENVGTDLRVCPDDTNKIGEHTGSPLHKVVQWFKTMTTNYYIQSVKYKNWQPFNRRLWQRNYYEHIIRNTKDYENITNYIYSNPANWLNDDYFTVDGASK